MATTPTSASTWTFDVFLSFRGEDTRRNFTSHLYAALVRAGINTFKDDEKLERGEVISEALKRGIMESRYIIIIFSRNYANSHWCLEELSLIMECLEKPFGQKAFPVFLMGVDPLEVQHQKGSFGEPFGKHEERFDRDQVEQWRSALHAAAQLSGWSSKEFWDEEKLVKKIVKDISALNKSKKRKRAIRPPSPQPVIEMPIVPFDNLPSSQRNVIQQMLDCIDNPEIGIIGVYGMGGVGKTTLAKLVNNIILVRPAIPFDTVIMVTVSATPKLRNLQNSISRCLGLPKNRDACALFSALWKKKFLLFFDDVWHKLKLEDVGIPHPQNNKGSKIVVISRNKDSCTDMGAQKTIKVQPLLEEESWILFVCIAGNQVESNVFRCFAQKIVDRCRGLPLAIVTVAHAMTNRVGVSEWANAAREMEQSAIEIRGMKDEVFVPLKFSFDRLEDNMLRSLFLHCACFPHLVSKEDILDWCTGEGLVDGLGNLKDARNKAESLIGSLKIACMLEQGELVGSVKVHDLMRELAHWITSSQTDGNPNFVVREGESVKEAPQALKWLNATKIFLLYTGVEELPELRETCGKLTALVLRRNRIRTIPPTKFFQHMNHLRVLDLSNSAVESLPDSLSCLVNLRVLRLRDCRRMRTLPALGIQLQVLDLYSCDGLEQQILQFECMGGSSDLRYLNVEYSNIAIPVGVISSLEKLEELRLWRSKKIKWRVSGSDHREQREDSVNFIDVEELPYLAHLSSLTISFQDIIISDWFKPLATKITKLEISDWLAKACMKLEQKHYCRVEKQEALQALNESQSLRDLRIEDCQGLKCARIAVVTTLLENCEDLEVVLDCEDLEVGSNVHHQDSLKSLELRRLPKLERICVNLGPQGCFVQLTQMVIEDCKSLKMVFTKEMPRLFKNLESLVVENCGQMQVIFDAEEEGLELECNKPNGGVIISPFPKLKSLHLGDLTALHDVCSNHILHCPLVSCVTVKNCPRLKKDPLPIRNMHGLFVLSNKKMNCHGECCWIKDDDGKVMEEEIQASLRVIWN